MKLPGGHLDSVISYKALLVHRTMRQGAQGRYTGITLRYGMGREVGGGFRMGDMCTPMADSCQYMAKTHYNIVISFQLK